MTTMKTELSNENKKNLLQQALHTEYGIQTDSPAPKSITIDEVFESEVIYNVDGQLYRSSFTIDEATNKPTFGQPEKVIATKVFNPMEAFTAIESVRSIYKDIVQEAGKRNAARDSKRLNTIMALIQELLDSEEPDEKTAKEVMVRAESELAWIKTLEATKTEDGADYPASAYAYVPDK